LGQPRQGPEKPGLFRRFHQFSTVQPSSDHGQSVTSATGAGAPDSTEVVMMVAMRGWWQNFQSRRRHRKDIRAFQRLMDARAARRAGS
jgi:hypothetical protein